MRCALILLDGRKVRRKDALPFVSQLSSPPHQRVLTLETLLQASRATQCILLQTDLRYSWTQSLVTSTPSMLAPAVKHDLSRLGSPRKCAAARIPVRERKSTPSRCAGLATAASERLDVDLDLHGVLPGPERFLTRVARRSSELVR